MKTAGILILVGLLRCHRWCKCSASCCPHNLNFEKQFLTQARKVMTFGLSTHEFSLAIQIKREAVPYGKEVKKQLKKSFDNASE
jgi:hypothetical protein